MMRKRSEDLLAETRSVNAAIVIHDQGLHRSTVVRSTTLIVLYTEQDLDAGANVFDELGCPDLREFSAFLHELCISEVCNLSR